jgi:hypothetical protein
MGIELFLFSYGVGLIPILYGLSIVIRGRVYLSLWSREPMRGLAARFLGIFTIVMALAYYATITWAWSFYDR